MSEPALLKLMELRGHLEDRSSLRRIELSTDLLGLLTQEARSHEDEVRLRYERMSPFFDKWHMDGNPIHASFHIFSAPDHGDPHDHPADFHSYIVEGGYIEEVYQPDGSMTVVHRRQGDSFDIAAEHIHRIVELPEGRCVTLVTFQPHRRRTCVWRFDGQPMVRFQDEAEFRPIHSKAA